MALHPRPWRKSRSSKGLEVAVQYMNRQKLQQAQLEEGEEGFSFSSSKSYSHANYNYSSSSGRCCGWLHEEDWRAQLEVSPSAPARMSCADELFLDGKIRPLNNYHPSHSLEYDISIISDNPVINPPSQYSHSCNGNDIITGSDENCGIGPPISAEYRRRHRRLSSSSAPASPLPADSTMMPPPRPEPPPSGTGPHGSTRWRWWRSLSLVKRVLIHTSDQTAPDPPPLDDARHPHKSSEDILIASKVQTSNPRATLQDYLLAPQEDLSRPLLQQSPTPSHQHDQRLLSTHDHSGASARELRKTSPNTHHQRPPPRDPPKRSLSGHHQCTSPTKGHNKPLGRPNQGSNKSIEGSHINRPPIRSTSLKISNQHQTSTISGTPQLHQAIVCPNHATTSKSQESPINVGTTLQCLEVPPTHRIYAKGNGPSHQMSIAKGLQSPIYNVSSSYPPSPPCHRHRNLSKYTISSSPTWSKSSISSISQNASHIEKLDTKGIKRKTYLPNHHVLLNCLSFNFIKLQHHFSKEEKTLVH